MQTTNHVPLFQIEKYILKIMYLTSIALSWKTL